MKSLIFIFSLLVSFNFSFAQTQLELNMNAEKKADKTEKELNDVYRKILLEYKADTAFIKNLKIAQKLWLKLRDAEMLVKFPHSSEPGYYGSVFPICSAEYEEELTRERISKLKIWLSGIEEGDVSSGSVKTK